jgi:hypothetical protein
MRYRLQIMTAVHDTEKPETLAAAARAREQEEAERELKVRRAISDAFLETALARRARQVRPVSETR